MTIQCKAAILRETGAPSPYETSRPLSIEDVNLAPPEPAEVVVKIKGAGLCHSDLSVINGSRARPLPISLGHEGAGEVVEVGAAITDIKVGDSVVFQFSAACGRCRRCLEGRPQVCEASAVAKAGGNLMAGGSRITDMNGDRINHHSGISCMSEYAVADRGSVVVIDDSIPLADAALFGCAVMTGVGAVINTARIRPGDSVAIVGLGGVGLNGLFGACLGGAETIVGIDIDDTKLALAKDLGATHAVNATDKDCVQQVRDITNGGVDFAFELAGTIAAMNTAYSVVRYGGSVVTAGLSPVDAQFSFNHSDLVGQEKSICGSYMGSCVPVRDIPRFLSLYSQGRLPVDRLIDGHITFDELNRGFDNLQDRGALRQILIP